MVRRVDEIEMHGASLYVPTVLRAGLQGCVLALPLFRTVSCAPPHFWGATAALLENFCQLLAIDNAKTASMQFRLVRVVMPCCCLLRAFSFHHTVMYSEKLQCTLLQVICGLESVAYHDTRKSPEPIFLSQNSGRLIFFGWGSTSRVYSWPSFG